MAASADRDPLLAEILFCCKFSQGTMPLCILVRDAAEQARGELLLKGRHNNSTISFMTRAEHQAGRLYRAAPTPDAGQNA